MLVACGWLFGGGKGGEGVFLGEVKARRKDIISSSLDYQKQRLSTDKQFIFKPQFTRHAGKAGGLDSPFVFCFRATDSQKRKGNGSSSKGRCPFRKNQGLQCLQFVTVLFLRVLWCFVFAPVDVHWHPLINNMVL